MADEDDNNFQDGWGDDDDLDLENDDDDTNDVTSASAAVLAYEEAPGGGEGDDDDDDVLFGDGFVASSHNPTVGKEGSHSDKSDDLDLSETSNVEDENEATALLATAPLATTGASTILENPAAASGWDDDDDNLDFSESNQHTDESTLFTVASSTSTGYLPTVTAKKALDNVTEGWNDDSEGLDFSDHGNNDEMEQVLLSAPTPITANTTAIRTEGWCDDDSADEQFFGADNDDMGPAPLPIAPSPPQSRRYAATAEVATANQGKDFHELRDYLLTLPAHANSVTAVLNAEYNTLTKAIELQQYYAERPALAEYTVNKELPRMDYLLTDVDGDVITDKAAIAQLLLSSGSLCARCANQSLLADVLQVLTGEDRVVRPQYFATAIATHCRFRVDLAQHLVEVVCALDLSLPSEQGRWKVAEIRVVTIFQCSHENKKPYVEFRLADISLTASPQDADFSLRLEQCGSFLEMLHESQDPMETQIPRQQSGQQNFRDVFLQSQNRLQTTASDAVIGMKSAWQDFDAATGFGSKLKQLPTFLPDTALLEAAEEEERLSTQSAVQNQPQQQQQKRPTSILGGLVRSLAQSVALPDEDPTLYQDWKGAPKAPATTASGIPRFYNQQTPPHKSKPTVQAASQLNLHPDDKAASAALGMPNIEAAVFGATRTMTGIPRLYNTETPVAAAIPCLYNKETPPTAPKPVVEKVVAPLPYRRDAVTRPASSEPVVKDGWDDVDSDSNGDDDVEETAVETTSTATAPEVSLKSWVYDPATDIIPTRKRWINPRPGSRELSSLTTP